MNPTQRDLSLKMLADMMLIRAYEEKAAAMQASGAAAGTCTSVGQEASSVGVVHALGQADLILTNHRSAGHLLARGADPARLYAEVLGKATGYCKGKSGSLHISVKELGVVLTSTIVGAELSLATGVALAQKVRQRDGVVACFFGDGAACEGSFHESLNLASLWSLPILYVCENNQWQSYVHRREAMPIEHVRTWATAHALEAVTVNGNDAEAVHAAAMTGLAYVRECGKPFFLETYTYRLRGHFEPDDQGYVDKAELAGWQAKDPIPALTKRLGLKDSEARALRDAAEHRIGEAWTKAAAAPYPSPDELLTDVYA